MKKILIVLLVIFCVISLDLMANENENLKAVDIEKNKLTSYWSSLQRLKTEMTKIIEFEPEDISYSGPALSESIYPVLCIDSLLAAKEDYPERILAPLNHLAESILQYITLTDNILNIEKELYGLQNDFGNQPSVERFQEKMRDRRKNLDEFEALELWLSSNMNSALSSCLKIIEVEISQIKDDLHWLEEQRDVYLVVRGISTMHASNMVTAIENYYQKCAEYDQSDERQLIDKLSETDTLLVSKFRGVEEKLNLVHAVEFYKRYLQILDDTKIAERKNIHHNSPDSITSMIHKKCATAGLDSLRHTLNYDKLLPVAKASLKENDKTYSIKKAFWLREKPTNQFEFDIYQIATFDPHNQNKLKTLSEATEHDWQDFSDWLGVALLSSEEQDYVKKLAKHRYISTPYRTHINSIRFKDNAIFLKVKDTQLRSMGFDKTNALKRQNKMLHPRRLILRADAGLLGDFMQLGFSDQKISQLGVGNYAYGLLLGYRFKFDSTAIADGHDKRSNYIGIKYIRQEVLPGKSYHSNGGRCMTCEKGENDAKISSLSWDSEELHFIYSYDDVYLGVGIADASFLIQKQLIDPEAKDVLSEENIDKQLWLGVVSLGKMYQYENFSLDIYGRIYVPNELFKGFSCSIGVGLAFQLLFLR